MMYRPLKNFVCVLLVASVLVVSLISVSSITDVTSEDISFDSSFSNIPYDEYIYGKQDAPKEAKIEIDAAGYSLTTDPDIQIKSIDDRNALITGETGSVSWEFYVEQPGLYDVQITYYNLLGKGGAIERLLYLDESVPYKEAQSFVFLRTWMNEGDNKIFTASGNEYRRDQIEERRWTNSLLNSSLGYRDDSLKIYLSKGKHLLTLEAISEPMAISNITLCVDEPLRSYFDITNEYEDKGYDKATKSILIEGEDAVRKSDPTLYAVEDRTSPINSPFDVQRILLNSIGGNSWRYRHQWIEWDVDIPEDGLYTLSFRGKQTFISGAVASRRLFIDGEVPFAEVKTIPVSFDLQWQMITVGGDEAYEFYLEKGKHSIRLEAVIGYLSDILEDVNDVINELNSVYRQIKMIVGNFPDPLRDYELEENIPELFKTFNDCIGDLKEIEEKIVAAGNIKGEQSRYIDQLIVQLKSMVKYPDSVPERINDLSDNINNLSSWLASASEVPLVIDYLYLSPKGEALPPAQASFFRKIFSSIKGFFYSFIHDYYSIEGLTSEETIENDVSLWLGIGRDQAMIIKNMADSTFTAEKRIGLKIRLVDMAVLLQAVSSGSGPDAAIFMDQALPMNYGVREALWDLNSFSDIDEVLTRFKDSAIEPYRLDDQLFGLPEQQVFPMLFYRKDIFNELGVEVPQTWDDLYKMIPVLQEKNMEIGLPSPATTTSGTQATGIQMIGSQATGSQATAINPIFAALLFQNGASIYDNDKKYCILNEFTAVNCFIQWTEFYNKYNFPKFYSDINRFRTGEMPVIISPFTFYNTLVLAAPEIKSLWGIAPIPGTLKQDGSIDRSSASTGTACVIFRNANDPQDSWNFLKWWTSTETQIRFGREIEALQGSSARWPTANINAMKEIGWSTEISNKIQDQWKFVKGIPEVPGGYYVGRSIDNAIKSVINTGEDARETILDQIDKINKEIHFKRVEFGLE